MLIDSAIWTHESTHAGRIVPSSKVIQAGFGVAFFAGEVPDVAVGGGWRMLASRVGCLGTGGAYHYRTSSGSDKKALLGVAYPLVFGSSKGGLRVLCFMPKNLKRLTGRNDLHFITFCCYQRRALLGSVRSRNLVIEILREVRAKYGFSLVGYVLMPEHVHLLISEAPSIPPAKVIQVFKQRVSRRIRGKKRGRHGQLSLPFPEACGELRRFWQRRYYDFNVYSRKKLWEKLHYMHANPVEERLVRHPREWPWSSWSFYATGEGLLKMDPA